MQTIEQVILFEYQKILYRSNTIYRRYIVNFISNKSRSNYIIGIQNKNIQKRNHTPKEMS
jgi:hypothetical protein